jgi:hypothetical protein
LKNRPPAPPLLRGEPPAALHGSCTRCGAIHTWANDAALGRAALSALFDALEVDGALARDRALLDASPGKMIGVAVVQTREGRTKTLRAFSGDLGGQEEQPGWVGSLVRRADTSELQEETWRALNALDAQLKDAAASDLTALRAQRLGLSKRLMAAMIDATTLTNQAGTTSSLRTAFVGSRIPSGTADCVLPKLLVAAHTQRLRVLAVAEAWWGPPHGERRHGDLQPPCATRCAPILGFLLCPR